MNGEALDEAIKIVKDLRFLEQRWLRLKCYGRHNEEGLYFKYKHS
jgi:hypothetical protein